MLMHLSLIYSHAMNLVHVEIMIKTIRNNFSLFVLCILIDCLPHDKAHCKPASFNSLSPQGVGTAWWRRDMDSLSTLLAIWKGNINIALLLAWTSCRTNIQMAGDFRRHEAIWCHCTVQICIHVASSVIMKHARQRLAWHCQFGKHNNKPELVITGEHNPICYVVISC